jgi:hypothetical protein
MPELSSGDGTIVGGVDAAYAVDDTADDTADDAGGSSSADRGTLPERSLRPESAPADQRPARTTGAEAAGDAAGAVLHPSATDADAPHHPDAVPAEAFGLDDGRVDSAPSAAVAEDAPVVAPEVPGVAIAAPGTGPEEVPPADAAYEDAPPALEPTPGAPDAVLDEPVAGSDATERTVAVGGSPDAPGTSPAPGPSATRSPLDDPDAGTGGSAADRSTHQ